MKGYHFIIVLLAICAIGGFYYSFKPSQGRLYILNAGSLVIPFEKVSQSFQLKYPNVEVIREAHGSRECVKLILGGQKHPDIFGSADWSLIADELIPVGKADWVIIFAGNEMVLAYTEHSKYADEINSENWFEIIARTDVKTGHADPDVDPCGYRAYFVLQLAAEHYGRPEIVDLWNSSNMIVRHKSVDLIALLEAGELDYAFEYRSVAVQHGLRYVDLPPQVDLGSLEYADFYAHAQITLKDGKTIRGEPIAYGITILNDAENKKSAVEWLKILLGQEGQRILEELDQPPIVPALTTDMGKIPDELKAYVTGTEINP